MPSKMTNETLNHCVKAILNEGGFTASVKDGIINFNQGYFVALDKKYEKVIPLTDLTEDEIAMEVIRYIFNNAEPLSRENIYLGGWVTEDKLYLDVSQWIKDLPEAILKASQREQIAFFSNKTKEVIFIKEQG